jgi:hypothetical protein
MIRCVCTNCDGDVEEHSHPKFESIMLPTNHAIFSQALTEVSDRIEFPTMAARIPGSIDLCNNTSNSEETWLHRGCNPDVIFNVTPNDGWGSAPLMWDIPVGSCIVARKEKRRFSLSMQRHSLISVRGT